MIGLFKVSSISGQQVRAKSQMNSAFEGTFYVPPLYRAECSSLASGDVFFGVLDDDSGLGAMLYKVSDGVTGSNALSLSKDLHVTGSETVGVNLKVTGQITGNSTNTTINLTAAHAALIVASGLSGTAAPLTAVPVIMQNE